MEGRYLTEIHAQIKRISLYESYTDKQGFDMRCKLERGSCLHWVDILEGRNAQPQEDSRAYVDWVYP